MPRYKDSPEVRAAKQERREKLRELLALMEVEDVRDLKSEFEPPIIRKNETSISWDIEEKIISMYAKGMTTNDISAHIEDIYGIEVSDSLVSRITDKILPVVKEWQ